MPVKQIFKCVVSAALSLLMLFAVGCNKTPDSLQAAVSHKISKRTEKTTINDNYRTWYEVFVYSFYDSDKDGIGDLNGVYLMLDYIEYLGFDGIWLMPINPSTTYHKYDVTDYYGIDPVYGSMEDFDKLIAECDKRGIAVILDLVVNHTSDEHEWFKTAKSALLNGETDNPCIDYYNFSQEKGNGQWSEIGKGWYYESQFWDKMPDLNLENMTVRTEFEKIFKFWLEKGVDGFRLDAAKEYVTGNAARNYEILSWINDSVKMINPNAYLVGEVWEENNGLYEYYKSGLDSFFDFNFAAAEGKLAKTLLNKSYGADEYASALVNAEVTIRGYNAKASDAFFFTNHDTARASGFLRRDPNLIKMAWGMNIFQSGNTFVYYGEEIGMTGSGKDENKRAPMFWTNDIYSVGMTIGPPGMDSMENSFSPALTQIGDDTSILEFVRKAITIRNKYPEIARGETVINESLTDKNLCVLTKTYNDNTITLIYNTTTEPITITEKYAPSDYISASGEVFEQNGSELTLPPYSISVLNGKV